MFWQIIGTMACVAALFGLIGAASEHFLDNKVGNTISLVCYGAMALELLATPILVILAIWGVV